MKKNSLGFDYSRTLTIKGKEIELEQDFLQENFDGKIEVIRDELGGNKIQFIFSIVESELYFYLCLNVQFACFRFIYSTKRTSVTRIKKQ